jgi:hypothetical protein
MDSVPSIEAFTNGVRISTWRRKPRDVQRALEQFDEARVRSSAVTMKTVL